MHSGMGAERAVKALGFLQELFPRWKTTGELNRMWTDLLAQHEAEVVTVVLKAHRIERRGNDPSLTDVHHLLAAAARQRQIRQSTRAPEAEAVCPGGLTNEETAAWILAHKPPASERGREDMRRVASGLEPEGECFAAVVRGEGLRGIVAAIARSKATAPKSRAQREKEAEQERQRVVRKLDQIERLDGKCGGVKPIRVSPDGSLS